MTTKRYPNALIAPLLGALIFRDDNMFRTSYRVMGPTKLTIAICSIDVCPVVLSADRLAWFSG